MTIRTINDPSGLSAELVERLVGLTAYDVVKTVAMYLPEIQLLGPEAEGLAAIAGKLNELASLVPELEHLAEIAENLDEIINGEKPASSITYGGETLDVILARLLYQPIVVSNVTVTPSVAEVGTAVTSMTINWMLSRSGAVQKINGQSIAPNLRTFTSTVPVGVDTTFTVRVEDGPDNQYISEGSAQLKFRHKRYWGTSALATLDDTAIIALSSEFAENRNKTINFDATGGKYIYYAYPAEFGLSSVKVQGQSFSDYTLTTRSFRNASNVVSSYNIIRFNGLQTGSNIEVTFA